MRVVTFALLTLSCFSILTIDLSSMNKYGNQSILDTPCNIQTTLNFNFSDSVVDVSTGSAVLTNPEKSTMQFFDINGNDLNLTLKNVAVAKDSIIVVNGLGVPSASLFYFLAYFSTADGLRNVYVAMPIYFSDTPSILNNVYDPSKVSSISFVLSSASQTTLKLLNFNFLNERDFNSFYQITNADKTSSLLISSYSIQISIALATALSAASYPSIPSLYTNFVPDYAGSGNRLCYGSSNFFQTHLRQSWPLWTWMISLMFYWIFYLYSEAEVKQCFDRRFQNNKMTSWGLYSLYHLADTDFFSRLSRASLIYFVFSFQAVVLSAIYSTQGTMKDPYTNYELLIWASVIAFAASLPLYFIVGRLFLVNIYKLTLQKYNVIKQSRGTMLQKETEKVREDKVDDLQDRLYSYYYIFYMLVFIAMVCFWVPSIYMMMQIPRNWYYLQRIWLASIAITFVLDNLIFDPLLASLFGGKKFYQNRGFYYDFALGQAYKQIQE